MSHSPDESRPEASTAATPSAGYPAGSRFGRDEILRSYPAIIYVFPFVVFMVLGIFEPRPEPADGATPGWSLPYEYYPWVYSAKIALTVAAIAYVWPGYRQFPWRVTFWAPLVGGVGVVVWVGLTWLQIEARLFPALGLGWMVEAGARSGFNPLEQLAGNPILAYAFLAIRFFGLVVVVALIEEFFLRAFLMRFVVAADWWNVPFGKVNPLAVAVGTLVPVLMHPAEMLAAAVWFSMVTWLMLKTRNIWDCVVAHAVTNLLLGLYVVLSGEWHLM